MRGPAPSHSEPAEQASEALELNQILIAALPVGVLTYSELAQCVSVNERAARIVGGTLQQLREQNFRQIESWKTSGMLAAAEAALATGTIQELEAHLVTRFGKELWLRCHFARINHGGRPHLLVTLADITESKQAEEALRASEERFRQVTENIESVFWMSTPGMNQMLYISPAYERIWGRSTGSLYAEPKSFIEAIHPDDREWVRADVEEKLASHAPRFQVEYRIVRPDGFLRWIRDRGFPVRDATGKLQFVVGIADDISEFKALQRQLTLRQQELDSFFTGATAGLVILDKDLRFVRINQTLAEMNGVPVEQHLGKTVREVVPGLAPTVEPYLQHVLRTGQPIFDIEVTGQTQLPPAQQRHWVESFFPVLGEHGRVAMVGAIVVEVTERKQLEAQLRQAQKMELVGRLAGGVAHDFNNALAVIRLNAELLSDPDPASPRLRDGLSQIKAASDHAATLTRQLLAFGRKQVMHSRALDLNELIGNLTKMLTRVVGEDIQFQCTYATRLPCVHADAGMLEQVLLNLVVNARDAMPKGGQLAIRTARVTLDEAYSKAHSEAQPGSFVQLTVSDTGTGIEPDHLPRIFEPFFTTKEAGKGSGLGLATVYGIVKQHLGWIEVASTVGTGTTLNIFLPAHAPAPAAVRDEPELKLHGGTETILLVEDDGMVRSVTRRVLESHGYMVLVACSAREALEVWRSQGSQVALIITDMVMPEGSTGRELAEKLRTENPGIKVIFISGYSADVIGKDPNFFERTNSYFLEKPFSARALIQTVRQCLDAA
jgi:PAS domain S-box-containing protein